ncbi:MAG: outer membrane protein assembly factor BamE [Pseudomonadota bacterium]|nr:outer membrane protein assembly factor BamE [Pseudomonadota bacterium]
MLIRTFVAFLALSLSGCETRISKHGMVPTDDELALIKPGVHNRGDVRIILGSPSTVARFKPKAWYYVESQFKKKAIANSSLLARKIVEIQFDDQGFVKKIKSFDTTDEQKIRPVERETPTGGKKLTIIQQLIGNAGRFIEKSNDETNSN